MPSATDCSIYTDPGDGDALIADVVVRHLRVNRDPRGVLVETLRSDWTDCYSADRWPFAQTYYSVTEPWVARDEDRWHVHERQSDRFVVPSGNVVLALCDAREGSRTQGRLNLIRLGSWSGDARQHLVLIPPRVLHGFMVVGPGSALLINYPTRLYDPLDEGRVPFGEIDTQVSGGRSFSWDVVRDFEGARTQP